MRNILWFLFILSFIHQGLTTCNYTWYGPHGKWSTPNFPKPYGPNLDCFVHIITNAGTKIFISVPVFELERAWTAQKCDDYLKIIDMCKDKELTKRCGKHTAFKMFSNTNMVVIHFHSDDINNGAGVNITWKEKPANTSYTCKETTLENKHLTTRKIHSTTFKKIRSPVPSTSLPESTRFYQSTYQLMSISSEYTTYTETKSTLEEITTETSTLTIPTTNVIKTTTSPDTDRNTAYTSETVGSSTGIINITDQNRTKTHPLETGTQITVIIIISVSFVEFIIIVAGCFLWKKRTQKNRSFKIQKRESDSSNPNEALWGRPRAISFDRHSQRKSESENVYHEITLCDIMPIIKSKKRNVENFYCSPYEGGRIPNAENPLNISNNALSKSNGDGYELATVNSNGYELAKSTKSPANKPNIKPKPKTIPNTEAVHSNECEPLYFELEKSKVSQGLISNQNSPENPTNYQNGTYEFAGKPCGTKSDCMAESPYSEPVPSEGEYDTLRQTRKRKSSFLEKIRLYGVVRDQKSYKRGSGIYNLTKRENLKKDIKPLTSTKMKGNCK